MGITLTLVMSAIAVFCSAGPPDDVDRSEVARELGSRACAGDFAALDELEKLAAAAYEEFGATQSRQGFEAIRPAFDILGEEAGKGNKNALEALLRGIHTKSLRGSSTEALGVAAGMGNKKAIEPLLEPEKHGILLSSAVGALVMVAKTGDQRAVDFLVNVTLDEHYQPLWFMAADGLGKAAAIGNRKALRALTSLLDRSDSLSTRRAFLSNLREAARNGKATKAAVPTLVSLIRENDREFQSAAMEVLASIGPEAAEAVPDLIPLLSDANLRLRVVETLVKIGPPALPHLAEAARDETVRQAVEQASKRIRALAGSRQAAQAPKGVIATVLSTKIYATGLEPPQDLRLEKKLQLPVTEFGEWLAAYHNEQRRKINSVILSRLFAHYDEEHALAPTDLEIEEFTDWSRTSQTEQHKEHLSRKEALVKRLQSEKLSAQEREKIEAQLAILQTLLDHWRNNRGSQHSENMSRQMAKTFILSWKRNKSLFDLYGGRVIFQQFGLEPLDAYLAFLKDSERRGDLAIYDASLREIFWDYFTSEKHNFLSVEESHEAMAKPMWLMDSPE